MSCRDEGEARSRESRLEAKRETRQETRESCRKEKAKGRESGKRVRHYEWSVIRLITVSDTGLDVCVINKSI